MNPSDDELKVIADQLQMAYGDLPSDRPPGPPTSIINRLHELAAAHSDDRLSGLRNEVLEEAALACDAEVDRWDQVTHCEAEGNAASDCAATIRALKTEAAQKDQRTAPQATAREQSREEAIADAPLHACSGNDPRSGIPAAAVHQQAAQPKAAPGVVAEVIAAAREIPGMAIKAGARLYPPRLVAALAALDAAPRSGGPRDEFDRPYALSLADAVANCRVTCKHEPSAFDLEQQGYDTIVRALRYFAATEPSSPVEGAAPGLTEAEIETKKSRLRWMMSGESVPPPVGRNLTLEEELTLCDLALLGLKWQVEESTDSQGDWQCKDYADGWITFPDRKAAVDYHKETGALMRYRRFYHAEKP